MADEARQQYSAEKRFPYSMPAHALMQSIASTIMTNHQTTQSNVANHRVSNRWIGLLGIACVIGFIDRSFLPSNAVVCIATFGAVLIAIAITRLHYSELSNSGVRSPIDNIGLAVCFLLGLIFSYNAIASPLPSLLTSKLGRSHIVSEIGEKRLIYGKYGNRSYCIELEKFGRWPFRYCIKKSTFVNLPEGRSRVSVQMRTSFFGSSVEHIDYE